MDLYNHVPFLLYTTTPFLACYFNTYSPFQQLSSFDEPFPILLFILVVSLSKKFDFKMIQKRIEKRPSLKDEI